jgi:hypothetical protein
MGMRSMSTVSFGVVGGFAFALAACSGDAGTVGSSNGADSLERWSTQLLPAPAGVEWGTHGHVLPWQDPATATMQPMRRTGAHLTYYGGPVISNVKVVEVLYGSGTYLANITGNATPTVASFYGQVTKNAYFTALSEYDTPTQKIGAGTYASTVQITPSSGDDGSTITDAEIQAEINAQIAKGKLPAPDANTIYMTHFPKGKTISMGGSSSCVAGGFCAYHGTFSRNGSDVYYGVLPDMSPGSGCDTGCGGSTQFNNQTSVASHELAEAVTDAAVGLATTYGPPLAWYDSRNGEIGDICNGQQGTITGTDGHTYTVQKLWSNAANACVIR